jgi:hypothetical protein
VICWFSTIFLLSYNFLQFDEFIFSFQNTYNSRLKKRCGDDPSTHLYLWLKEGSSGGPDKNWVYGLSNPTIKNLWMARSISTIGCSQLVLSIQTPEFAAMLDQRVQDQTTHLNEKYERLTVDYEELHRMVMKIRSQISSTCVPVVPKL